MVAWSCSAAWAAITVGLQVTLVDICDNKQ